MACFEPIQNREDLRVLLGFRALASWPGVEFPLSSRLSPLPPEWFKVPALPFLFAYLLGNQDSESKQSLPQVAALPVPSCKPRGTQCCAVINTPRD